MRWNWVTTDLSIKVFSLLVALFLFLFVSVQSTTPVEVDFSIEYRTDDDIMVTDDPPAILHATLQGPWASFRSFDTDELEPVSIDLRGNGPGTLRRRIEISEIHPPSGMKVVAVARAEIDLTLDRVIERQVPVNADIVERPAFGYEIVDVRVDPPRVRLVGPSGSMQTIDFVYTRPIDVNGLTDDLQHEVPLRSPPPPLKLKQKTVKVFVEVGEEFVERRFEALAVEVRGATARFTVNPRTVGVVLRGPRRSVDALDEHAVKAYVDVTVETTAGQRHIEKQIEIDALPEQTVVMGNRPKVVVDVRATARRRR
ncbi:MAG: CdaR family protein [Myxococcota bacterium]